jgi:Tfp pilus assembly pilus retraction ATPase PilT
MSGMYSMKDLLNLVAEQRAAELRLEPGRPPMMLLQGKVRVLDGPVVSTDQIGELFRGIATEEQRRELDLCGSTRFRYAAEKSANFNVRADLRGDSLSMSIKNLQP